MSGDIGLVDPGLPGVAEIVIDNPEGRNRVSVAMAGQFLETLTALEADDAIKVIIFSGTGPDFCSGVDVQDIAARFRPPVPGARQQPLSQRSRFAAAEIWWGAQGLFARILHSPKITIAAAQGQCLEAGLYFSLFSDLTIASRTAEFGNPAWQNVGVNGDIAMLIAAVGLKRAKEMIYTGACWSAEQAQAYGLIDDVVSAQALRPAVEKLATTCAMIMRDAIAAEKQVVLASLARMQIDTGLAAAAVIAGWGSNLHFRTGEFNLLREMRDDGEEGARRRGESHFES